MSAKWRSPGGDVQLLYKDALAQPHLMIAGATGSGKSVIVNALVYTALYRSPDDEEGGAQFIFIDPKRVELIAFKPLPHTIVYASEPSDRIAALNRAMSITEDRYKAMQRQSLKKYTGSDIYVIIDEFADLMTTDRRHVQPIVQRLAQIGRAARVHIILCTQCPLAKVIPTEIKVNFDARFALRTATAQHSRNIMEQRGCECLPKHGRGYYMTPEGMDLYKIPMIPPEEVERRIRWWTDQKPGLFRFLSRCHR